MLHKNESEKSNINGIIGGEGVVAPEQHKVKDLSNTLDYSEKMICLY